MPLPKEYYDILKSGDRPFNPPTTSSGMFPDLTPDPVAESGNALWDFLGAGLGGFTSGITWGVSSLAGVTGEEPWEEMTGTEKGGWILGEGASLFAPWGPFGLMAKGSRLAAKGANKFVGKAAQEAAETGIARLTGDTAKAVVKASEKGINFSDDIVA